MTHNLSSGNGWVTCRRGHRHWGRYGAAGLLLVKDSAVLLQLRSAHVHHGDTWSIPGGARDLDESATEAAGREAFEEIGLDPASTEPIDCLVDEHGGWAYTTVIASWSGPTELVHNYESERVAWVPVTDVTSYPLHPGFAASWPQVRQLL